MHLQGSQLCFQRVVHGGTLLGYMGDNLDQRLGELRLAVARQQINAIT